MRVKVRRCKVCELAHWVVICPACTFIAIPGPWRVAVAVAQRHAECHGFGNRLSRKH